MKFFLYSSCCISGQFEACDLDIMRCALTNNARHGITGFLHRNRTHYFQYIEGRHELIEKLVLNIQADDRHFDFRTLMSGDIISQRFAGWTMGYSQPRIDDNVPYGITAGDPAGAILNYLLDEADRQIASLARSAASVSTLGLIEA